MKKFNKTVCVIIVAITILVQLTGCEMIFPKNYDVADLADKVLDNVKFNSAAENTADYLESAGYMIDTTRIEEIAYYTCASGAYPDEILFIKFKAAGDVTKAMSAVTVHEGNIKKQWEAYKPEEMYKIDNSVLRHEGVYLLYAVTADNDMVRDIIDGKDVKKK